VFFFAKDLYEKGYPQRGIEPLQHLSPNLPLFEATMDAFLCLGKLRLGTFGFTLDDKNKMMISYAL
jgi:hypothetical protein